MLTLTIAAPSRTPALTANQRLHWAVKARRTAAWRARAYDAAILAGRPSMNRAHVRVTVHATTNRKRDVGNYAPTAKALVDGIVTDGKALPGDDDAYLVGPDLRAGEKRDVLTFVVTLDDACTCHDCTPTTKGDRP